MSTNFRFASLSDAAAYVARVAGVREAFAEEIISNRDTYAYYYDLAVNTNRRRGENLDVRTWLEAAGVKLELHHKQAKARAEKGEGTV